MAPSGEPQGSYEDADPLLLVPGPFPTEDVNGAGTSRDVHALKRALWNKKLVAGKQLRLLPANLARASALDDENVLVEVASGSFEGRALAQVQKASWLPSAPATT